MRVVVHNLYCQQVQTAFSTLPAFAKGHLPAQSNLCPSHHRYCASLSEIGQSWVRRLWTGVKKTGKGLTAN